jgi:hypothetical protein
MFAEIGSSQKCWRKKENVPSDKEKRFRSKEGLQKRR